MPEPAAPPFAIHPCASGLAPAITPGGKHRHRDDVITSVLLIDGEATVESLPRGRKDRPAVYCPHCGRLGEYRKRQRSVTLTEHFAHASGEECVPEDLANALHARAIAMLVARIANARAAALPVLGLINCRRCGKLHMRTLLAAGTWTSVATEIRVTTAAGYRVPDIVVRRDESPVLFVEVAHTSLVDDRRLDDLRALGVPGCEVFALDVVENPTAEALPRPREHWNVEERSGDFSICASCRRVPPHVPLIAAVVERSGHELPGARALEELGKTLQFSRPRVARVHDLADAFQRPESFSARDPSAALGCAEVPPSESQLGELTRMALGWKGWGAWTGAPLEPTLTAPHALLIKQVLARCLSSSSGRDLTDAFAADVEAADQISIWTGCPRGSSRLECHALLVLHDDAAKNGHTAMELEDLVRRLQRRLPDLTDAEVRSGLRALCVAARLHAVKVGNGVSIGSAFYAGAEAEAASDLRELLVRTAGRPVDAKRATLRLDADQERAIAMAHESAVSVVTGGPGTGKTTLVCELAHRLGGSWFALAPTWKALSRLRSALGDRLGVQFETVAGFVARTTGVLPDGTMNHDRSPFRATGCNVIIDEAGCLDSLTLRRLLEGTRAAARVLFIGDPEQLPSVAPGAVLRDLLSSGRLPQVTLGTTHRSAADSGVPRLARSILEGRPDFSWSGVAMVERNPEGIEAEIVRRYAEAVAAVGPLEVQVLSPVNRMVDRLNRRLQSECNPGGRPLPGGARVNDPIVARATTETMTKGETGRIVGILDRGAVRVEVATGRYVVVERGAVDLLAPAYCLTVHKAQGSEWRRVLLAFPECGREGFLDRPLLYTAITRARDSVLVVGSRRAVEEASKSSSASDRRTLLSTFLALPGSVPKSLSTVARTCVIPPPGA